jgi:DUF971 family protein
VSAPESTKHWPTELRLNPAKDQLTVHFESGEGIELAAEYLRVQSPSAEVKGHGTEKMPPVAGKRGVRIARLEPVGNYAVRIVFDDGHDTGLYTWDYLHELANQRGVRWPAYLEDLAVHGLQRD